MAFNLAIEKKAWLTCTFEAFLFEDDSDLVNLGRQTVGRSTERRRNESVSRIISHNYSENS